MNDEPATNADLPTARRRVRIHMLLKGAFVALSAFVVGTVNEWLPAGWTQPVVIGLIVALLGLAMQYADQPTSDQRARVRAAGWVALVVSALAGMAVAVLADQVVATYLAVVAAAAAVMSVWAVVSWWVSR